MTCETDSATVSADAVLFSSVETSVDVGASVSIETRQRHQFSPPVTLYSSGYICGCSPVSCSDSAFPHSLWPIAEPERILSLLK